VKDDLLVVAPTFLTNSDNTKYYIWFQLNNGNSIRIPISLADAIIEKRVEVSPFQLEWIPDNLSTIEFQAKQKGLV
jgi:hypothetical protein